MKDKKQEIELSILSDENNYQHKILERAAVEILTAKALEEIETEQMELWDNALYWN